MDADVDVKDLENELQLTKEKLDRLTEQIRLLNEERGKLRSHCKELESKLTRARINDLVNDSSISSRYDQLDGFPWSAELYRVLRDLFRISAFRPLQLKALNATLDGKDVILVMPTGAGKSLVYQLPAFLDQCGISQTNTATSGPITLVVSPLVSLMTDQSMSLRRLGLPEGSVKVFDASSPLPEQKEILDALAGKNRSPLRLLYVTPEKLAKSKRLLNRLEVAYSTGRLSRIAVDEVHCLSQWGHDFRPDYQFLHVLRRQFPKVPLLCLTATASGNVIVDVQSMLGIKPEQCLVLRGTYNRKNLFYEVLYCMGAAKSSLDKLYELICDRFHGQSGIVYCFSQQDTHDVAADLCRRGLNAAYYHANMDSGERTRTHADWFTGHILVIVATVAFGMGIDKPDVRFVIHFSSSKSLENYYQESGRAGRDSQPAQCVLFWRFGDLFRLASMVSAERTGLNKLFHMVSYSLDPIICQRQLIAKHLDDTWSAADCDDACDNCRCNKSPENSQVRNLDVGKLVDQILSTLSEHASLKRERITGLKLVDLINNDPKVRRIASVLLNSIKPPREFYEHVVAWCVVNGFLKLEFHFTPYSTVCYVVPGPDQLFDGDTKITFPYRLPVTRTNKHSGSTDESKSALSSKVPRTILR